VNTGHKSTESQYEHDQKQRRSPERRSMYGTMTGLVTPPRSLQWPQISDLT
jgi:hypothetical protein